jgi:hypothetical protein
MVEVVVLVAGAIKHKMGVMVEQAVRVGRVLALEVDLMGVMGASVVLVVQEDGVTRR